MYYIVGYINGDATLFDYYKTKRAADNRIKKMTESGVYSHITCEYKENTNVFKYGLGAPARMDITKG